eukprot:SAG11_NODE_10504_length_826_cov_0.983494_1_plen_92_part_00
MPRAESREHGHLFLGRTTPPVLKPPPCAAARSIDVCSQRRLEESSTSMSEIIVGIRKNQENMRLRQILVSRTMAMGDEDVAVHHESVDELF